MENDQVKIASEQAKNFDNLCVVRSDRLLGDQFCHVKGCGNHAENILWVPKFGTSVCMCKAHFEMDIEEKRDLIIELLRAKRDHENGINEILRAYSPRPYG